MEEVKTRDDAQVIILGVEMLISVLGPADTLRFLALMYHEATDYLKFSEKLYEDQSVKEIFNRAKKHWDKYHKKPSKTNTK